MLNKDDRSETGYQIYGWEELPDDKRRYSVWNSIARNSEDFIPEQKMHKIVKESVNKVLTELDWRTYYSARDKAAQQMNDPSVSKDVRNKRYDQYNKFFQAGEGQMEKQHNINGTEVHNSMRGEYGKSFPSYTDAHIARRDRMDKLRGEYNDYINGNAQYKNGQGWQ